MLLLVRHSKAGSRKDWNGDDRLRPLSEAGWSQARGLVPLLSPQKPTRLLSSPYVRCVQTLEPLSQACHLPIEVVDELAEGRAGKAVKLAQRLATKDAGTIVLCTHGDIVPEILRHAEEEHAVHLGSTVRWPKGATWILESNGKAFTKAMYLRPPD